MNHKHVLLPIEKLLVQPSISEFLIKQLLALLILLMTMPMMSWGNDLEEGLKAYMTGNYQAAFHVFRPLAEQGDSMAQFGLGTMYQNGYGALKDNKKAVKWYRLAAEQGVAIAQFNLGVMYGKGEGASQNHQEAVKWFRLAAEQGNALAQNNLGLMYDKAGGILENNLEAVKWYRLAAEQGNASAQFNLGVMYAKGHGVTSNYINAHMWFAISESLSQKDAKGYREIIEKRMSKSQIARAEELARECIGKVYKGC